jgi:hypothetical protein
LSDKSVQCWGNNDEGQSDAPEGTFVKVEAGGRHSCALDTQGSLRCWGSDQVGQLEAPKGDFVDIIAGYNHTCARKPNNSVICWGAGEKNRNNGVFPNFGQSAPPDEKFIQISGGYTHTCGVRADSDEVECWGSNANGLSEPTPTFAPLQNEVKGVEKKSSREPSRILAPSTTKERLPSLAPPVLKANEPR